MSDESNYDNDIPVAPSLFVSSPCQFASDEWYICSRRSVACTRCGEDTKLCHQHTEGLCAECREPDPREKPMSDFASFVFELARDISLIYRAGMKAGSK